MKKAEVNFGFRDDQSASGHLYLFRVEKDEEFTYGWGGKVSPEAYARGWIARLNGKSFISGFDTISINSGDTLILYHESDLTTPWILTRMVASHDSAVEGEKVTITLEQTECELIQGLIYEKNFTPVSDRQIQAKETWFTDHEGKAEIIFEGTEPLRISSGNDAVIIIPRIATGISDQNLTRTRVFPNPATEMIWISGITDIREIELTDREGRILRTTVPLRYGEQRLDLHNLPAGIYFLRIRDENGHHVHKVIKK